MLQNAYFLAKIGADTAENDQEFAEILPIGRRLVELRDLRLVRDLRGCEVLDGAEGVVVAHGEREDLGRRGGPDVAVPLDLLRGLGEVEGPPPRHRGPWLRGVR